MTLEIDFHPRANDRLTVVAAVNAAGPPTFAIARRRGNDTDGESRAAMYFTLAEAREIAERFARGLREIAEMQALRAKLDAEGESNG